MWIRTIECRARLAIGVPRQISHLLGIQPLACGLSGQDCMLLRSALVSTISDKRLQRLRKVWELRLSSRRCSQDSYSCAILYKAGGTSINRGHHHFKILDLVAYTVSHQRLVYYSHTMYMDLDLYVYRLLMCLYMYMLLF